MGYKVEDAEAWSKTDVTHTKKAQNPQLQTPKYDTTPQILNFHNFRHGHSHQERVKDEP